MAGDLREAIKKAAQLTKIAVEPNDSLEGEALKILSYIKKIGEVDVEGISPMYSPIEGPLRLRKDVVSPGLSKELVMSMAPKNDGDFFIVPRVVEEGN